MALSQITRIALPIVLILLASRLWLVIQSEMTPINVPIPTIAALRAQYGNDRNLTSKETRDLYHKLINEIGKPWEQKAKDSGTVVRGLAVGCNLLRHRLRLYARERDTETSAYLLAVRDVWVHCIAKLNMQSLLDIPSCLLMLEDFSCPSLAALEVRKGQKDEVILASVWKSNEGYDKKFS